MAKKIFMPDHDSGTPDIPPRPTQVLVAQQERDAQILAELADTQGPVAQTPPRRAEVMDPEFSIHGHSHQDLEKAALLLLDTLDQVTREVIIQQSYLFNRYPLWVTVAGLVLRAAHDGTHQTPALAPNWPRRYPTIGPNLAHETYACEHCGEAFTPKRFRQRFCSNECGSAHLESPAVVHG